MLLNNKRLYLLKLTGVSSLSVDNLLVAIKFSDLETIYWVTSLTEMNDLTKHKQKLLNLAKELDRNDVYNYLNTVIADPEYQVPAVRPSEPLPPLQIRSNLPKSLPGLRSPLGSPPGSPSGPSI